jgi:hypothetical protein
VLLLLVLLLLLLLVLLLLNLLQLKISAARPLASSFFSRCLVAFYCS